MRLVWVMVRVKSEGGSEGEHETERVSDGEGESDSESPIEGESAGENESPRQSRTDMYSLMGILHEASIIQRPDRAVASPALSVA